MHDFRHKNSLSILAYFLAWLAPAISLVIVDSGVASIAKLIITILFLAIWHFAFKRFLYSVYFSLIFFILLPFDLFFFFIYQEPLTTPVLLSVGNTNFTETVDFMRGRFLLLFAFVIAAITIWLQAVVAARHGAGSDWRCFNPVTRYLSRSLIGALAIVCTIFTFGPALRQTALLHSTNAEKIAAVNALDDRLASVLSKLGGIFPLGRFISLAGYYREEAIVSHAEHWKSKFHFNAKQIDTPLQRQIYVLVIGETARGDHSYLNGYSRETSPFLTKEKNLIRLRDVVSPWSMTRLSVPTIVTGERSSQGGGQLKSIVSAFREAGFKTYWLSNQQHESGIDYFAREADERIFQNISALVLERNGNYDENLLVPLEKLMKRSEARQFFVVHLLGSHDAYQKRYPKSFDVFKPSLTSEPDLDYHDVRNKTKVINSYDNSMRYTDYVLSNIISTVKQKGGVSALIYSSDHGETLFDGSCQRSGHGSSGRQEFIVNALSWTSDEHKEHWPEKYQFMEKHADAPLTTELIFETLLGLANISTDKTSPQHNLAGSAFRSPKRWVNGQQTINWDSARPSGACNLLTANKQE